VGAFAGLVGRAVTRGEVSASWQATGADAVIQTGPQTGNSGPGSQVTPAAASAITAVPGVRHAATVWTTPWQAPGGQPLTVLAVDPARYAALVAATPFPSFPAAEITLPAPRITRAGAGPLPVIASPAAAALLGRSPSKLTSQQPMGPLIVRVAGVVTSTPAQPGSGTPAQPGGSAYVVMPMLRLPGANGQPAPQTLLLAGAHIDQAALAAVVQKQLPVAGTTVRSVLLASLTGAPLQRGANLMMLLTLLAAAGLALSTLVMGLALGAAEREVTLARLTTMGHERPVRLVLAEAMPAVLAAVAAGVVCAVALPRLVGSKVDLSVFTGTGTPVPLRPDWTSVGLLAAAIVAIAAAALTAETAALRRRGVTGLLRAH
jgi:hypothetical protein